MGIVDNDEFEKIVEDAFESNDRVHIFRKIQQPQGEITQGVQYEKKY